MTRFVRLENQTRGTVLAERCRVARGPIQTILGLHIVPRLQTGEGLLLPGATTIDTTFMRYPIDLVFMDRSRRVTRTVSRLNPWRFAMWNPGARDCLELPAGALDGTDTAPGDQLAIEEIAG
jgi:uncharacterized membrane protein (UPF0127 family)